MPASVKVTKRKTIHTESDDDIATGTIKGLKDYKDGRFSRLKNADELEEHFRNL